MENCSMATSCCSMLQISWLWFFVALIITYSLGALWFGKLFMKPWAESRDIKCEQCNSDFAKGEKCNCKHSPFPMIMQFIATALIGLMIFVLTNISAYLALFVLVATAGWMKANLAFQVPDLKKYFKLASIEVGYYFVCGIIFLFFALIKCCHS